LEKRGGNNGEGQKGKTIADTAPPYAYLTTNKKDASRRNGAQIVSTIWEMRRCNQARWVGLGKAKPS